MQPPANNAHRRNSVEEVHKSTDETPLNLSKPRDDEEEPVKATRRDSDSDAAARNWRDAKNEHLLRDYVMNQRKSFAGSAAALHEGSHAMSHPLSAFAHARGGLDPALLQHPYFAAALASGNPFLLNPFAQPHSPPARTHTSPSPPSHLLEHEERNMSPQSAKTPMHPLLDRTNVVSKNIDDFNHSLTN